MKSLQALALFVLTLSLAGCGTTMHVDTTYTFDMSPDGWTVGFADLPVDYEPEIYELDSGYRAMPSGLEGDGLYIRGHNRSDDLFMFFTRQVRGLAPRTAYDATFIVDVATSVPVGMVGVGGSPGESVYLKAGATPVEPRVREDDAGYSRMNIDKGNQANGGPDMIVLGTIGHPDLAGASGEQFMIKRLDNEVGPLRVTSDEEGAVWVIVGTDSGFEGPTALYYDMVAVELEEADR